MDATQVNELVGSTSFVLFHGMSIRRHFGYKAVPGQAAELPRAVAQLSRKGHSMAPKGAKRKTVEELCNDLERKQRALREKAQRAEVQLIATSRPDVVPRMLRAAAEAGVSVESLKQEKAQKVAIEDGHVNDDKVEGMLSPGYYTIKSWSSSKIQEYLSFTEEISLSNHAMRGLLQKGQRVPTKSKLEEIGEFVWGLDNDWSATGVLRQESALKQFLKLESEKRGRRGRDLRLPADWGKDGIYSTSIVQDLKGRVALVVKHKFIGEEAVFPAEAWTGSAPSEIYVKNNHSEQRAQLADDHRPQWKELLLPHFSNQVVKAFRSGPSSSPVGFDMGELLALTDKLASGTPRKSRGGSGSTVSASSGEGSSSAATIGRTTSPSVASSQPKVAEFRVIRLAASTDADIIPPPPAMATTVCDTQKDEVVPDEGGANHLDGIGGKGSDEAEATVEGEDDKDENNEGLGN